MPSASAHAPRANEPSSQALSRQLDAVPAHQTVEQHSHDKNQSPSAFHAHGDAHDHSVSHTHGLRLSGLLAEVSPVLAGVWTRVFAILVGLGLLWLAIFWAFAGDV